MLTSGPRKPAQGRGAQVVVAGNLNYTFSDALQVFFGVQSVPSTRSTNRTFPYWLRNDNRPIADEFFRGSYTQGIWAEGKIMRGLEYRVMVANNLSALGVSAASARRENQHLLRRADLDADDRRVRARERVSATSRITRRSRPCSAPTTRSSTETPQSQPGTNSIENTQIRLSDGTLLFAVDAFNTPGRITQALYQMMALDAAVKYQDILWSSNTTRDGSTTSRLKGSFPSLTCMTTASRCRPPPWRSRRRCRSISRDRRSIGQYGDPYDVAVGINWFPFHRRDLRVNVMGLYTYRSPVGYTAYPVPVGATGFTFLTDVRAGLLMERAGR